MKKVCVVTTSRADYGLLYPLMKEITECPDFALQVVATGMHLSPEFGLTWREIEKDGFVIDDKIETILSSDTPVGISKSIGLGVISFAEVFQRLAPDVMVGLGDRFELFAAATAAMVSRVPIAHLHGGELTEGLIDDPIRHSITKMAHLHFTATEEYRRRVIQLGEAPEHVFTVGAMAIDNIVGQQLMDRRAFEESINFQLRERNLLVTFHPTTLEAGTSAEQFSELLAVIEKLDDVGIIFTAQNADTDGRIIGNLISDFVRRNGQRSVHFTSLGMLRYLSALVHVDAVVGNSSSGIIEAPALRCATINIGDRQRGRLRAASIIDCEADRNSISAAFSRLWSEDFRKTVSEVINPYGDGCASKRIIEVLRSTSLEGLLKKRFHDLELQP